MKKFAFFTLLSICLTAIAVTNGHSRSISSAYVNNIADTTPKTTHHTAVHKTVKKTTTSKTKKPTTTDSTHKR